MEQNYGYTPQQQEAYTAFTASRPAMDWQAKYANAFIGPQAQISQFAPKATMGAEGQMWQNIQAQQAAMRNAASRRGYNPDAERAAMYAGGEMESQGWGLANQLRAAEEQRRKEALLALAQRRSEGELAQMGMDAGSFAENIGGGFAKEDLWKQKQEALAAQTEKVGMGMAQGAATVMGGAALSDRRVKQAAYNAGRADQDALMRTLAPIGPGIGPNAIPGQQDPTAGRTPVAFYDPGPGAVTPEGVTPESWQAVRPPSMNAPAQGVAIPSQFDAIGNLKHGIGVLGGYLSMSDAGAKRQSFAAGMQAQDTLLRNLAREGARTDLAMGWQRSQDDARARNLLEQLGQSSAQTNAAMGWAPPQADATIGAIRPKTFEYKPQALQMGMPGGQRYGVMAQDLEKTPLGKTMVVDTPAGKVIDHRAATGAILAMLGRLGERLDNVEGH